MDYSEKLLATEVTGNTEGNDNKNKIIFNF